MIKWRQHSAEISSRTRGAQPAIVAAAAARMRPPYALPELVDETVAGFYKVEVDVAADQPSATYFVQLPPEYDPLRRYPMIVSLHAVGMDPKCRSCSCASATGGQATNQHACSRKEPQRLHRHRPGLDRRASKAVRRLAPRGGLTPWCWATSATPAAASWSKSTACSYTGHSTGQRRSLGYRRLASRSDWRDAHLDRNALRLQVQPRTTPGYVRSTSCWASWMAGRIARDVGAGPR